MLNFRNNIHKIKFYGALEQAKEKRINKVIFLQDD